MKNNSDVIFGKIEPKLGSIKIVRIDGYLESKQRWENSRWINICRFPDCTEHQEISHLCNEHYNYQLKTNIDGEKIEKSDKTYIWSKKEWKLLCTYRNCNKIATKNKKCSIHNNSTIFYSSIQDVISIYNNIKSDLLISKQKKKLHDDYVKNNNKNQ